MTSPNEVGLDAVFKTTAFQAGLSQYLAGQARAVQSTKSTASQITSAGSGMASSLSSALSALGGPISFVGNILSTAIGSSIGTLTGTLLPRLVSGLADVASGVIAAVSDLQLLDITLETLSAREIRLSGAAGTMGEALQMAGPMADQLLGSLRELSIVSPFEYKDVVNTFRLNMAFGNTSESAVELTRAILNLAAGMGLTGPMLERISYNFSQMQLVGKITARDIRDLAMAGVDLSAVLREELGMSMEQANEALQSGAITFKDISEAFVRYSDTNFGGAAQRASRSLSGLASSFRDLLFFASADLFGPAFDTIGQAIGGVFDKANEFVSSGILEMVGAGLDVVAQHAVSAGGQILQWAGGLFTDLDLTFEGIAERAFGWGFNIVEMLARGIIAAASALVDALLFIGRIITSWLGPGSPPKIAPDLPAWGQAAMETFLGGFAQASGKGLAKAGDVLKSWGDSALNALFKGFSSADFDIFGSILGPLEQALGIMERLGSITEEEMRSTLGSISELMAGALAEFEKTGSVGPAVFDQLRAAGGELGDELADLLGKQLDLAAATKEVEAAEKGVEAARKAHADASQKVNSLTDEYNKMLRGGASKEALDAKLKEINAAEEARRLAGETVTDEEKRLEAAKEAIGPLKEAVKLQEELIRALIEQARQQIPPKEPIKAPEKPPVGGGPGGGGGGGGGVTPVIPGLPPIPDLGGGLSDIEKKVQGFRERIEKMFAGMWANIRKSFEESELAKKWDELTGKLEEIWNEVQPVLEEKWASFWSFLEIVSGIVQPRVSQNITDIGEDLQAIAKNLPPIGDVFSFVFGVMGAVAAFWGGQIAAVSNGIATAIDYIRIAIEYFAPFWDWLHDQWVDASWIEKVGLFIAGAAVAIFEAFTIVLWGIAGYVKGWVLGIVGFFTDLYNQLVGKSIVPDMMDAIYNVITGILTTIATWVGDKLEALRQTFATKASEIKEGLATAWNEIQTKANTVWTEITTAVTTKIGEVYTAVTTKVGELKTWWDTTWGNIRDALTGAGGILAQILTGVTDTIGDVVTEISDGIGDALEAIGGKITEFYDAGKDIIGGLVSGVVDSVQGLIDAVIKAIKDAIAAARKFLGAESPARLTMPLGGSTIEGFALGMTEKANLLGKALDAALRPLVRQFRSIPSYAGAAYAPAPLGNISTVNNYYTTNAPAFDFGRNNVASPAQMASMEGRIRRIVREELRKR